MKTNKQLEELFKKIAGNKMQKANPTTQNASYNLLGAPIHGEQDPYNPMPKEMPGAMRTTAMEADQNMMVDSLIGGQKEQMGPLILTPEEEQQIRAIRAMKLTNPR